ncbi:hypothetical protein ACFFRR_007517 [Megaselia abdita]
MKHAIVVLAFLALSVQGYPQKDLPVLKSFKTHHVRSYIEDMQISRASSLDGSLECYTQSSATINQIAEKSVQGNEQCNLILSDAQTSADAQLKTDRDNIDAQNIQIQTSLQSCQGKENETPEVALTCYVQNGQSNVSPVSDLTFSARKALKARSDSVSAAESKSNGCSVQVASDSEKLNMQVYVNLNECIAGNGWTPIDVPDFVTATPTEAPAATTKVTPKDTPAPTKATPPPTSATTKVTAKN